MVTRSPGLYYAKSDIYTTPENVSSIQGSWKEGKKRNKSKADNGAPVVNGHHRKHSKQPIPPPPAIPPPPLPKPPPQPAPDEADGFSLPPIPAGSMAAFLKKALRMEGPQLQQRLITIKKNARESLGMRIGGGIGSNEGDTPIYIANIHPHGCIGKSKQMKVGIRSCISILSRHTSLHREGL